MANEQGVSVNDTDIPFTDQERLDWLGSNGYQQTNPIHRTSKGWEWGWYPNYPLGGDYFPTLREAIDAAMQKDSSRG